MLIATQGWRARSLGMKMQPMNNTSDPTMAMSHRGMKKD